ncbi:MAG: cysteine hydrolase [Ruminococcaceae bacterium]|nr:cysteine hydrolase [Oscillospiraceae bacterium]
MKVLIVVDYQNDFVCGALKVYGARLLDNGIAEYIRQFDGKVFYTIDCHGDEFAKSREAKYVAVHCKSGSWGCEIYGDVKNALAEVNAKPITKSTFAPTKLKLGDDIEQIELCGLLTDMCVLSTAVVAEAKYPDANIKINSNLCLGSSPKAHESALSIMRGLNMEIT